MSLVEHAGIREFEERIAGPHGSHLHPYKAQQNFVFKGSTYDQLSKLRSRFRKHVRGCADKLVEFASTRNGSGTFVSWKEGFQLAQTIPISTMVFFARFEGATAMAVFYTPDAIAKLDGVIAKFTPDLNALVQEMEVEHIMTS